MITTIIILALLLGGGTSIAAEHSMPGEVLYPVKVFVNEGVRGSFAFSDEANARVEAWRAQRRLAEAEMLSVSGKLNADTQATVDSKLDEEVSAFSKDVADMTAHEKADAAAETSSDFEAALSAHERILAELAARGTADERSNALTVLNRVRDSLQAIAQARADAELKLSAETGASVQSGAEGKLNAAENKIAEVKKFIEHISLSAQAQSDAQAKLALAENAIVSGKTSLNAKNYGVAFADFQQAIRLAQEAQVSAQTEHSLNLDIKLGTTSDTDDRGKSPGATASSSVNVKKSGEGTTVHSENSVDLHLGI